MSIKLNETHDPALTSWVASANDSETSFTLQNLPFGVFRRRGSTDTPRVGVAIGDRVLDVAACSSAGLLAGAPEATAACAESALNRLMALGPAHWSRLRLALSRMLRSDFPMRSKVPSNALAPIAEAELLRPAD